MSGDVPLPVVDDVDAEFWVAARDHEFRMQRCSDCDYLWWAPGAVCPKCWSRAYEWVELSGRGRVNSWVVFHQRYLDAFADDIPYAVAEVELAEGPRYLAPIVDCEPDDVHSGMPVVVAFRDVTDEFTLPMFRLDDGAVE